MSGYTAACSMLSSTLTAHDHVPPQEASLMHASVISGIFRNSQARPSSKVSPPKTIPGGFLSDDLGETHGGLSLVSVVRPKHIKANQIPLQTKVLRHFLQQCGSPWPFSALANIDGRAESEYIWCNMCLKH